MTSPRKVISNQRNSTKSTGPASKIGKKNMASNALQHGFYSRELIISEQEKDEFDSLRESLFGQLAPITPLQTVATEQIVASSWRCKLAIRSEMHRLGRCFTSTAKSSSVEPEAQKDPRAIRWYGTSKEDLRKAETILADFREEVIQTEALHLTDRKEQLVKAFGIEFYDALEEWRPTNLIAIGLAEMICAHEEKFGSPAILSRPASPEMPRVVPDQKQKMQMLVKLIDMKLQHLADLRVTDALRAQTHDQVPTDFTPRYFASASRDLQRAVDWLIYIKSKGL